MSRELNDLTDPEVGRKRLSGRFGGHDFSHLPLDKVLAPEDFPDPSTVQAARSRTEVIVGLVRREKTTLRQLLAYLAGARGHYTTAGTPEQIADLIEDAVHGLGDLVVRVPREKLLESAAIEMAAGGLQLLGQVIGLLDYRSGRVEWDIRPVAGARR